VKAGPTPLPGLMDIAAYKGGEGGATGHALASNENPLGAGEAALSALQEAARRPHVYPDGGASALRRAIAGMHGLDMSRVVCGNGSDELIGLLCRCYAAPGSGVAFGQYGFLMYRISALACGAIPVEVPEPNLATDVDGLIAAAQTAQVVFLANPNNPTGCLLLADSLSRLAEGIPRETLLVIDEAYAEYVEAAGYRSGLALVDERPNVVVTRTFSKIHGLAALRVGWAHCPKPVADVLNRVRGPFNCNAPGQAAAAAAVRDAAHVARSRHMNREGRRRLVEGLRALGFACPDSAGNFVLVRFGTPARAEVADGRLRAAGIRVRQMRGYGLPDSLRITVGGEDATRSVIAALADTGPEERA